MKSNFRFKNKLKNMTFLEIHLWGLKVENLRPYSNSARKLYILRYLDNLFSWICRKLAYLGLFWIARAWSDMSGYDMMMMLRWYDDTTIWWYDNMMNMIKALALPKWVNFFAINRFAINRFAETAVRKAGQKYGFCN